jgi:hypothetical protein
MRAIIRLSTLVPVIAVVCACLVITSCGKSALPPPVTVSYRDSLVGMGKVMQITNRSGHHLYNVRVIGRNFDQVSSASVRATDHLAPGDTVEVGWLEFGNWTPTPGETMEVYADDYFSPHISVIPR